MAYEVKGKTVKITGTSRCAIKIKDNFYTTELSAERVLPESDDIDLKKEYEDLFNSINDEVDKQMTEIIDTFARR